MGEELAGHREVPSLSAASRFHQHLVLKVPFLLILAEPSSGFLTPPIPPLQQYRSGTERLVTFLPLPETLKLTVPAQCPGTSVS